MKKFKLLFSFISMMVAMLLFLSIPTFAATDESGENQNLMNITLQTDKEEYATGEEIQMSIVYTNNTSNVLSGNSFTVSSDNIDFSEDTKSNYEVASISAYANETLATLNGKVFSVGNANTGDSITIVMLALVLCVVAIALIILCLKNKKTAKKIACFVLCLSIVCPMFSILNGNALAANDDEIAFSIENTVKIDGKDGRVKVDISVDSVTPLKEENSAIIVNSYDEVAQGAKSFTAEFTAENALIADSFSASDVSFSSAFNDMTIEEAVRVSLDTVRISGSGTVLNNSVGEVVFAESAFSSDNATETVAGVNIIEPTAAFYTNDLTADCYSNHVIYLPFQLVNTTALSTITASSFSFGEGSTNSIHSIEALESDNYLLGINVTADNADDAIKELMYEELTLSADVLNSNSVTLDFISIQPSAEIRASYYQTQNISENEGLVLKELTFNLLLGVNNGVVNTLSTADLSLNATMFEYGSCNISNIEYIPGDNSFDISVKLSMSEAQAALVDAMIAKDDLSFLNCAVSVLNNKANTAWGSEFDFTNESFYISANQLGADDGILDTIKSYLTSSETYKDLGKDLLKTGLSKAVEYGLNKALGIPSMSDLGDELSAMKSQVTEIEKNLESVVTTVSKINQVASDNSNMIANLTAGMAENTYTTLAVNYCRENDSMVRMVRVIMNNDSNNDGVSDFKQVFLDHNIEDVSGSTPNEYYENLRNEYVDLYNELYVVIQQLLQSNFAISTPISFVNKTTELGSSILSINKKLNVITSYDDYYHLAAKNNFSTQDRDILQAYRDHISSGYAVSYFLSEVILQCLENVDITTYTFGEQQNILREQKNNVVDRVQLPSEDDGIYCYKTLQRYSKNLFVDSYAGSLDTTLYNNSSCRPTQVQMDEMNKSATSRGVTLGYDLVDAGFLFGSSIPSFYSFGNVKASMTVPEYIKYVNHYINTYMPSNFFIAIANTFPYFSGNISKTIYRGRGNDAVEMWNAFLDPFPKELTQGIYATTLPKTVDARFERYIKFNSILMMVSNIKNNYRNVHVLARVISSDNVIKNEYTFIPTHSGVAANKRTRFNFNILSKYAPLQYLSSTYNLNGAFEVGVGCHCLWQNPTDPTTVTSLIKASVALNKEFYEWALGEPIYSSIILFQPQA